MSDSVWGIHADRTGDADTLFLKKNVVALGWAKVGDLKQLGSDRQAFRAAVATAYPERPPGSVPVNAGQLFRFVNEVAVGDLVGYPSKNDRLIRIGKVAGEYQYQPALEAGYPHTRPVKWINAVPRTKFTQGALYEIGSAMSLFQIKSYADEFRSAATGQTAPPPVEQDETVAAVSEEIAESTRDFVLKTLSQELKGHPFANFVAHLLNTMGYRTRVSPEGADGGIDIIAHRDETRIRAAHRESADQKW